MYVSNQVIDFIEFVLIGVLIASIFDFFRAYRKIKKVSTLTVMIQDSIYFIIVTMVIIFSYYKITRLSNKTICFFRNFNWL